MSIYRGAGGAGDAVNDSSSEATLIQQLAIEAQDSADAAATSETNAAASETAAASSASAASTSASNAATSATNASNSASSASTSATNAANSATAAQTAETAAELAETNAETAETNAETAASAASTSASNAATSATNASNSASSASTSATNASNSASAASTSASNASTSATAAAGSASSASTSASNASTSATNASNSATSASTSATTATTQAGIATTQATNAASSASAAATSATNAAASATTATTQASNASTSATNAASSATSAAASLDSFDDRYLGAKSSAPTLDNDGNALLNGALYFDSTLAAMRVYNTATSTWATIQQGITNTDPVRHSVRPSLLLDFANTKTLDPRITFTRASTATFYDGKTVAKAEENLVLNSENFSAASWQLANGTISINVAVSPDGTTTADKLIPAATSTAKSIFTAGLTVAGDNVQSVYVKADGYTKVALRESEVGGYYASFDLTAVSVLQASGCTATITSVGNSWYRIAMVGNRTGATRWSLYVLDPSYTTGSPTSSWTGDGTSGVLLWGAQLEQRSSVTAYTPTTTAAITNYIPALQTAAAGVARFEHNPVTGESLGLEIEEQRTNLLLRSEEFQTTWSNINSTEETNVIIAPDGTLTGDKLIPDSVNQGHWIAQTVTVTAASHTFSFFAKAGEYRYVQVLNGDSATDRINFDLVAGVLGSATTYTGTITAVGNGWYRCAATITTSAGSGGWARIGVVTTATAARGEAFAGNGYSGIYIWGAQLEAGAFATSYIPTVASQVTRSADSASMTGTNFSSWYRADEWTLYGEAENRNGIVAPTNFHIAQLISGTNTGTVQNLRIDGSSNVVRTQGSNGSEANQWNFTNGTAISRGSFAKGSVAYKVNDVALSSGGTAVTTDTTAQIPELNTLNFGIGVGGQMLNGSIKKLAYYPKRLTNAELQGLTTV